MAALSLAPRLAALVLLALAGCAQPPLMPAPPAPALPQPAPAPATAPATPAPPAADADPARARYDCDGGTGFALRVEGDVATLEGLPQGPVTLGRDAGGVTPQQSVWTSAQLRAEFGLDPEGRGARLHDLQTQQHLACTRR